MSRGRVALAAAACAALLCCATAAAQERTLFLTSARAFGPLRRPGVSFPHALHADIPRQGCVACHHHGSDAKGYAACGSCHAGSVACRNAFHRLCIGCHDAAAVQGKASVPRTCGECHVRAAGSGQRGTGAAAVTSGARAAESTGSATPPAAKR